MDAWLLALGMMVTAQVASGERTVADEGVDGEAVAAGLGEEAVAGNADVVALRARVEALVLHARAARFRPDPMVTAEWSNVPWTAPILGQHPMSGLGVKVQQTLVRGGKNDRREAAARAAVAPAQEAVQELRLQLRGRVRRAYWRLALVRRMRALTTTHIGLLDQLLAVARARYEVGKAGQQDLLRLQLLGETLTDDLADFDRDERRLLAELDAALNRGAGARGGGAVSTPKALPDPGGSAAPSLPAHGAGGAEALVERARERRPGLRRRLAMAAAKRAGAERVSYEGKPDLTAWAAYRLRLAAGMDEGEDFVSVGVGVPLPLDLDGRWQGQAAALRADADAIERGHAAELVRLRGQIEGELARRDRAAVKVANYEANLLPKARQTLQATLNAYQADRADFASLYQAEVALIGLERAVDHARADALDARIAIETLTGAYEP